MQELLFLSHRIPYPPNKGDKIRSFHLLRHLARRFVVHVGTFIDDDDDWQHVDALKAQCNGGEVLVLPLRKRPATARSLIGLVTGEALSLPYYRDTALRQWVDQLLARRPVHRAVVFSSPMAQYLERHPILRVADIVDVDSDKWVQYAAKTRWPASWIYAREGRRLLDYERHVARTFDASYFVSPAEAALFHRLAPESANRVSHFGNGVDTLYFSPDVARADPFGEGEEALVFTGAMDYWPNVDAVTWFAREALPAIRRERPGAVFYIVGSRPSQAVQALSAIDGVRVTGTVPDVRPYLAFARAVVAPLRIARGIQNKVLEAMAMARPTVVTPQALEGIDAEPGRDLVLAPEDGPGFARAVLDLLTSDPERIGRAARERVVSRYGWDANLEPVARVLMRDIEAAEPSHVMSSAVTSIDGVSS
jgi:sugar transferase (PEP-CTERM/EpsH1 system associated)